MAEGGLNLRHQCSVETLPFRFPLLLTYELILKIGDKIFLKYKNTISDRFNTFHVFCIQVKLAFIFYSRRLPHYL